jgi:hypothetical protein
MIRKAISLLTAVVLLTSGCSKLPEAATTATANDGVIEVWSPGAHVGRIEFTLRNDIQMRPGMAIRLVVKNLSRSRRLQFETWAGGRLGKAYQATLIDDLGNHYKRVSPGPGYEAAGIPLPDFLGPEKYLEDVVVFEAPVDNAKLLYISLPCINYLGEAGPREPLQIVIPVAGLEREK